MLADESAAGAIMQVKEILWEADWHIAAACALDALKRTPTSY